MRPCVPYKKTGLKGPFFYSIISNGIKSKTYSIVSRKHVYSGLSMRVGYPKEATEEKFQIEEVKPPACMTEERDAAVTSSPSRPSTFTTGALAVPFSVRDMVC